MMAYTPLAMLSSPCHYLRWPYLMMHWCDEGEKARTVFECILGRTNNAYAMIGWVSEQHISEPTLTTKSSQLR